MGPQSINSLSLPLKKKEALARALPFFLSEEE
jgi:hypothetical protein